MKDFQEIIYKHFGKEYFIANGESDIPTLLDLCKEIHNNAIDTCIENSKIKYTPTFQKPVSHIIGFMNEDGRKWEVDKSILEKLKL